ncbi:MAG: cytochrome c biogenesis protein CcdA [Nanoarchaeota archaeon]|nr:cytochrome c biogenesis protein CcdA [Nanoarchaeota archaeon]
MRIKKGYLVLSLILLGIIIVAASGFYIWNNQIVSNIGNLSQFSFYLILGFAFFAGIISFFSPCGLALLPAFLSYNMAMVDDKQNPDETKKRVLKIGIFSALGIITFYILLGIIFSLFGVAIGQYLKYFQYAIAILFVVFGIMLVKNYAPSNKLFDKLREKVHSKAVSSSGYKGFYIFGFAYGLDIIGCLFPLIAALVLIPIATGNLVVGISAFLSYSLALTITLSVFSYLIIYSKKSLVSDVLKSTEKIKRWMGIGLIIGGVALLLYYTFFGMVIS